MTLEMLVPLLMRWLHILSAIVAVGGSFFMYAVLRPAASSVLPDALHQELRDAVIQRWKRYVHTAIGLFLISGFYNYLLVLAPLHRDQPAYHMLFGIKFVLALLVFGLAIALTSSRGWALRFRDNARSWLGWLVVLAVVVVLISGIMRAMPRTDLPVPAPTALDTLVP